MHVSQEKGQTQTPCVSSVWLVSIPALLSPASVNSAQMERSLHQTKVSAMRVMQAKSQTQTQLSVSSVLLGNTLNKEFARPAQKVVSHLVATRTAPCAMAETDNFRQMMDHDVSAVPDTIRCQVTPTSVCPVGARWAWRVPSFRTEVQFCTASFRNSAI